MFKEEMVQPVTQVTEHASGTAFKDKEETAFASQEIKT